MAAFRYKHSMRWVFVVLQIASWAADVSAGAVYVAPVVPTVAPLGIAVAGAAPRLGQSTLPPLVPTLAAPSFAPALTPSFKPALSLPTPAMALQAAHAAVAAPVAAPAPAPGAAAPATLVRSLAERVQAIEKAGGAQASPAAQRSLDQLFSGAPLVNGIAEPGGAVNDEGVAVFGRARRYYEEVRRVVARLEGRADLSESLDVMDDSYGDVWAKLAAIEALAESRSVSDHNTLLPETLIFVDGVLEDRGRRIAVNTHRVYFHKAANPRSEIEEGLRRVNGYLKEVVPYFARGGKAEKTLGRLDEVVLAFDTRGYAEIKAALRERGREVSRATNGRVRFAFLDELAARPKDAAETRGRLNALIKRYAAKEGLGKIIEGVVYSRYVGMLLELKTLEHYLDQGWEVLQSGRELFDDQGLYVTELDAVVRDPATGRVILVEAKSSRMALPMADVLQEKVIRKLEVYAKHRARLERAIGRPIDEVVFSFDIGPNLGLKDYLQDRAKELSARYGFKVGFLFIDSGPAQAHPQGRRRR